MPKKKYDDVYFQLSEKAVTSAAFNLKVTNFFTQTKYDGTNLKSPTFEFAKATWCISIYPDMICPFSSNRELSLSLVRLNYAEPLQNISCTITLLDAEGKTFWQFAHKNCAFKSDKDEELVGDISDAGLDECDKIPYLRLVVYLFHDEMLGSDAEQVRSKIDTGVETLSQDLKELFLHGKNNDFILKVSGKEFPVHRCILMARSKVFEAMLSHDMKEKKSGVIDLPDCDSQAMEQFLFYVYSGKVKMLNEDNMLGLYYLADKYNMPPLKEECSEFIKTSLSLTNICDVIQFALHHNDASLLESATEYFVSHLSDILPTVEWMSFLKSNLIAGNELLIKASKKWNSVKS